MLNLFRMERYRACRAKATSVTIFILALMSFFSVYASTITMDKSEGINISQQFLEVISSPMTLILWAIMISVYVSAEYKNGFIKSIAGQIDKRGYLAMSKLFLAVVYTIVMFIVSFICVAVAAFVFSGDNVTVGFSSEVIILWFTQTILYVGFSGIIILISYITRSSSLGIGFGIFTACGLTSLIYTGISWLINKTGIITNFDLGSYMIETNLQFMKVGIPTEFIVRSILIGLAFTIIMTFVSVRVLNKRDI